MSPGAIAFRKDSRTFDKAIGEVITESQSVGRGTAALENCSFREGEKQDGKEGLVNHTPVRAQWANYMTKRLSGAQLRY